MTGNRVGTGVLLACLLAGVAGYILYFKSGPEQRTTNYTIGVINPNPGSSGLYDVFRGEMQKYAAAERWNLTFRFCDQKETFAADLKGLVAQHPDLIVTITTPGAEKAVQAFAGTDVRGIFILFDPVDTGIIGNLGHPGGNFTGIQLRGSVPKTLEWLRAIIPDMKNIFVPVRFDTESAQLSLDDLRQAAKTLGVHLNVAQVETKKELVAALDAMPEDTDAIFLLNSMLVSTHAPTIVETAIRKKLPTAASIGKDEEGVLLTYSTQHALLGKQLSRLAHQILQGQRPGDIPAEISDFQLVVNLRTAEQIGLTIPDSILAQADKVLRPQKQ